MHDKINIILFLLKIANRDTLARFLLYIYLYILPINWNLRSNEITKNIVNLINRYHQHIFTFYIV